MKQHQESIEKLEYQGIFNGKCMPGACKQLVALVGLICMDCIFFVASVAL